LDTSSFNNPEIGVESINISGTPTKMVQLPQIELKLESEQKQIINMERLESADQKLRGSND